MEMTNRGGVSNSIKPKLLHIENYKRLKKIDVGGDSWLNLSQNLWEGGNQVTLSHKF